LPSVAARRLRAGSRRALRKTYGHAGCEALRTPLRSLPSGAVSDPGPPARARAGGPGSKHGVVARASRAAGKIDGQRAARQQRLSPRHSKTLDTNKKKPGLLAWS
jgi:hypothetical protein